MDEKVDIEIPEKDNTDKCILHIDNFDGPLDLLWDLIKKSKLDITEISISSITEQYIEYLKIMEKNNLNIASEFIVMASDLLYYKSRAILPLGDVEDEYFVPPLPPDLIEKLLEYKKFQMGSQNLKTMFETHSDLFTRENVPAEPEDEEILLEVSLFDLLNAFVNVMEAISGGEQEEILFDEILLSDRIDYIQSLLKDREHILFIEIFSRNPSRAEVVVSFLAILEMTKSGKIKLFQNQIFGDIRIYKSGENKMFQD